MNINSNPDCVQQVKDLEEENKLLFDQLTVVQEELERNFHKIKDLEAQGPGIAHQSITLGWVSDAFPNALAEVSRLETLFKTQREIQSVEKVNALEAKLGRLFIESSKSISGIASLPVKLIQFWMLSKKKQPPKVLGGESFTKVIDAYTANGFDGANKLLALSQSSQFISANAYTALARYLIKLDPSAAAQAAYSAFEIDPKPYRLKWLACRIHEAGDVAKAEAMIELLPHDITLSDSEVKQIARIRQEAKVIRLQDARIRSEIDSNKTQIQKKIDEISQLAQSRLETIKELRSEQAKLEAVKAGLEESNGSLEEERQRIVAQVAELEGKLAGIEQEKHQLEEAHTALGQEKAAIIADRDEKARLAEARLEALEGIKAEQHKQAEQKNLADEECKLLFDQLHVVQERLEELHIALNESENLKSGFESQFNDLQIKHDELLTSKIELLEKLEQADRTEKFVRDLLEHEKSKSLAISADRDEKARLAEARLEALEGLRAEQAKLEAVKAELEESHGALEQERQRIVAQVAELEGKLAGIEQEKRQLEEAHTALGQEKAAIIADRDEKARLAEARLEALEELRAEQAKLEEANGYLEKSQSEAQEKINELLKQQQLVEIEMVRAETQIGLIKDLVLRDSGI